ncbi:MAG: hypothetical protein NPIRA06_29320 [Nitrospirales bacterium]|nr:MAG: hypothetical protein NPIRA06_29320 [Nitrospirales bacterium]
MSFMYCVKLKLNLISNFKFYANENWIETERIGPEKYEDGIRDGLTKNRRVD